MERAPASENITLSGTSEPRNLRGTARLEVYT